MRQALAGVLWSKQYYHYVVRDWLQGDPAQPPPPAARAHGRNSEWPHLYNADVISMPDKWEYPWYAAWDLAFHCLPLALVDPQFAKDQLVLMLREWYMHPNGQLPAYEWAFGDVNPPVHAWAAWRVYKIDKKRTGVGDRAFLERVFQKLLLNFTWWVNRKDAEGKNVFQGGFLGLDNIGVFDRSAALPTGGHLEQSDGTSWMAMYCLNMLAIAMELADREPGLRGSGEQVLGALPLHRARDEHRGDDGDDLWDEEDGFFYDVLHCPTAARMPLKVRSMVGLIPLFAVETLEPELLEKLPAFTPAARVVHRPPARPHPPRRLHAHARPCASGGCCRSSIRIGCASVLRVMLDETEFLSPFGVRALSRRHLDQPYSLVVDGHEHRVSYEPAESSTGLFGGNSNWRGPIWFPVNFLLVESLQKFHHYLGDDFTVECPTGSGSMLTLWQVADEISRRLTSIFLADAQRPPAGVRRADTVPDRSALARPRALPRVLPRRHRRRRGRQPPDRLDRAGRQAAATAGRRRAGARRPRRRCGLGGDGACVINSRARWIPRSTPKWPPRRRCSPGCAPDPTTPTRRSSAPTRLAC